MTKYKGGCHISPTISVLLYTYFSTVNLLCFNVDLSLLLKNIRYRDMPLLSITIE